MVSPRHAPTDRDQIETKRPKVEIWHNILWSRYKARIFSELSRLLQGEGPEVSFFHIAETDRQRQTLSAVDHASHDYAHACLFAGAYSNVPTYRLVAALGRRALTSRADLTILAGYDRLEYWVQAVVLRLRGKKIGVFCDSTMLDRRQTFLKSIAKRIFFGMCRCALVYGTRSKEYVEWMGMPSREIFKDCQAAAVPAEYTPERVRRLREEMPRSVPTILYVGRLSPEKGLDIVLRAFTKVSTRVEGAKLVVVGGGELGPALREQAVALGIAGSVDFAGAKQPDEIWPYYLAASCLVLASRREPWGLVVNEALTLGCPVVVSDRCGCVPELVLDGVTGYVFPCDDEEALIRGLVRILDSPSDGRAFTDRCLATISRHTPAQAALAIATGLKDTIAKG